mmetsp:Transcript_5955/g.21723  ORF Transcript_5955/g.21723 Transcript_5955/m.21723 type:complete len:229 (+) Transcript_5955:684-1370(+)
MRRRRRRRCRSGGSCTTCIPARSARARSAGAARVDRKRGCCDDARPARVIIAATPNRGDGASSWCGRARARRRATSPRGARSSPRASRGTRTGRRRAASTTVRATNRRDARATTWCTRWRSSSSPAARIKSARSSPRSGFRYSAILCTRPWPGTSTTRARARATWSTWTREKRTRVSCWRKASSRTGPSRCTRRRYDGTTSSSRRRRRGGRMYSSLRHRIENTVVAKE